MIEGPIEAIQCADVGIGQACCDIAEHAVIVKGVVGIEKAERITGKQPKSLVHGVIDALVGLRENADSGRCKTLDDLQRAVARGAVDDEHFLV